MDGITRAKLQEEIGVREIVEDVDALRLLLGFDCVKVLTPKVETRLRSAALANIPLKLIGDINTTCHVELSFPNGYPYQPLDATVLVTSSSHEQEPGATVDCHLTTLLQNYCAEPVLPVTNNGINDVDDDGEDNDSDEGSDDEENDDNAGLTRRALYPRAATAVQYLRTLLPVPSPQGQGQGNGEGKQEPPCTAEIVGNTMADASSTLTAVPAAEEGIVAGADSFPSSSSGSVFNYTCMMCGTTLFDSTQLEPHLPTQKDISRRGKAQPCASVFLTDAPSFVDSDKLVENSGRLGCPKCQGKVGQWCWTGSQCSCGVWVTPAFQFTLSKLDMKPASGGVAGGVSGLMSVLQVDRWEGERIADGNTGTNNS